MQEKVLVHIHYGANLQKKTFISIESPKKLCLQIPLGYLNCYDGRISSKSIQRVEDQKWRRLMGMFPQGIVGYLEGRLLKLVYVVIVRITPHL